VRRSRWLLPLCLAACASPPYVDDQTTPVKAYETFRSALHRADHDRAYATLSDPLREKIGARSRPEFKDGMIVIGQSNVAVKAIGASKALGAAELQPDGRALLRIRVRYLFFGRTIRLWLRPVAVVKVYEEGSEEPVFYRDLPRFTLVREGGVVGVRLPPDLIALLDEELEGEVARRLEAGVEWFLDDWEVEQSP